MSLRHTLTAGLAIFCLCACRSGTKGELQPLGPAERPLLADYYPLPQESELRRQLYVRVGRASGLRRLTLRWEQPLRAMLEQDGGRSGALWPAATATLTPRQARPAQFSQHLVVATAAPRDRGSLLAEGERWNRRKQSSELLTAGVKVSEGGRVLVDQRRLFLSLGAKETAAAAESECRRLRRRWKTSCTPTPFLQKLPEGKIAVALHRGSAETSFFSEGGMEWVPQEGQRLYWRAEGEGAEEISRGPLAVLIGPDGFLTVVERFSEETYLAGVVAAAATREGEARRALAVAARSLLLSQIGRAHRHQPFDVCLTSHCQAWAPPAEEDRQVVRDTAGLTLTWKEKVLEAFHGPSCGGQTAAYAPAGVAAADSPLPSFFDGAMLPLTPPDLSQEEILEKWLTHPARTYDLPAGGPWQEPHRWTRSIPASQLGERLPPGSGAPRQLWVAARSPAGRVQELAIEAEQQRLSWSGEESILHLLPELPSTLFLARTVHDVAGRPLFFVFFGAGRGSGLGLCQAGADGLARRGFTFREILRHYYRHSQLMDQRQP